jgi:transcriptional regulator with XRE-family HTH domain
VTVAEKFGENLMVHRRRARLSQEDVGFATGLHRTEIGQLERGQRLPRIDTLIKLAGALSVPPGDLLKGIAWKPSRTRRGRFLAS